MATQASMVVIAPLVVEIGREFGASLGAVGQARTINAGAAVLASLGVGPLIDRYGVRRPLAWGAMLAVAGAALSAAAPSLPALYGAQVVAGVGVAAMLSSGFAGVADGFGTADRTWAMGYVVAAQSGAWMIGVPLIGVLADAVSWRLSFAVPAAAALAAAGTALVALPAGAPAGKRAGGIGSVFRNGSARNWTLAETVAYAGWTAEITYVGAFYITRYGVSTTLVGFLLAAGAGVFALTTLNTARLLRHVDRRRAIFLAALGMGAALPLGFNVAPAVPFTMAVFWSMALCAGIRSTASSSLGLAQLPDQAGSMMASRTASAQLGYIAGAGAGGVLIDAAGFGTLGFVLGAVVATSALLILRVNDPGEEPRARALDLPEPVD